MRLIDQKKQLCAFNLYAQKFHYKFRNLETFKSNPYVVIVLNTELQIFSTVNELHKLSKQLLIFFLNKFKRLSRK